MGPWGKLSGEKTSDPFPSASSLTVPTTASEPKPGPGFQHFTVTLVMPGAEIAMEVGPQMSEQLGGDFTVRDETK
jgi:hypothetical protein